jgi:hypothetical protein
MYEDDDNKQKIKKALIVFTNKSILKSWPEKIIAVNITRFLIH